MPVRIIGKLIGATLLGCAGYALTGDPKTATMITTVGAGLLSGSAGNYLHEAFNGIEETYGKRLFQRTPPIDGNHHIAIALRQSNLAALGQLLGDFDALPPEASGVERQREHSFSVQLRQFIAKAEEFKPDEAKLSAAESDTLKRLPDAFREALAERSGRVEEVSQSDRGALVSAVLAEIRSDTSDIPPRFLASFNRPDGGWQDLFIRAAAERLKGNEAFKTVWTAEELAGLHPKLDEVLHRLRRIEDKQDGLENKIDSFVSEDTVWKKRILEAVSREKGVPVEEIVPILERLGHNNVPPADIPRVLGLAIDKLLAQAGEAVIIHNEAPAIDRAIQEARDHLKKLDYNAALARLDNSILQHHQEESQRRQREDQAEARAHFEKANIFKSLYDHEGAIAALKNGLNLDPNQFWRRIDLGDELATIGTREEAKDAFEEAKYLAQNLVKQAADDLDAENLLSIAYGRIGEILTEEGRHSEAINIFQLAIAFWETPGNLKALPVDILINIAKIYRKIGFVHERDGDFNLALSNYSSALALLGDKATASLRCNKKMHLISTTHNDIGKILTARDDDCAAPKHFRKSRSIRHRLIEISPNNSEYMHAISASCNFIGNILARHERHKSALYYFRRGISIIVELRKIDPSNIEWRRDIYISYGKIGAALFSLGMTDEGRRHLDQALEANAALIRDNPTYPELRRDEITILVYFAESIPAYAAKYYERALTIAEELNTLGRLANGDLWMLNDLKSRLDQARGA